MLAQTVAQWQNARKLLRTANKTNGIKKRLAFGRAFFIVLSDKEIAKGLKQLRKNSIITRKILKMVGLSAGFFNLFLTVRHLVFYAKFKRSTDTLNRLPSTKCIINETSVSCLTFAVKVSLTASCNSSKSSFSVIFGCAFF